MLLDLNDSGIEYNFFEGAEKLIEIWLSDDTESSDLRSLSRDKLDMLMEEVGCKIISKIQSETWDAYVLSESSLFIEKNRLILKTCGTTTPLAGINKLVELVKSETGFNRISRVFYSRKSFLRPDNQEFPHKSFSNEVSYLSKLFPSGRSHYFGDGDDEWYLFVYEDELVKSLDSHDTTYELLMRPIGRLEATHFMKKDSSNPRIVNRAKEGLSMLERSSLNTCFENSIVDDHEFRPCGFSMNALSGSSYHSIHVTPQDGCSYASYETNTPEYEGCVWCSHVIDIFKPESFILTLISSNKTFFDFVDFKNLWSEYSLKLIDHAELNIHHVYYAEFTRKKLL